MYRTKKPRRIRATERATTATFELGREVQLLDGRAIAATVKADAAGLHIACGPGHRLSGVVTLTCTIARKEPPPCTSSLQPPSKAPQS